MRVIPHLLALPAVLAAAVTPLAASPPHGAPADPHPLAPRGSLAVEFQLDEPVFPSASNGPPGIDHPLVETPLFTAVVRRHPPFVGLDLEIARRAPLPPIRGDLARLMWSHLAAAKPYLAVFVWEVDKNRFDVYLNGVLQEVVTPIRIPFWEDGPPPLSGAVRAGPRVTRIERFDRPLDDDEVARLAKDAGVPPLRGEGRTLFDGPLAADAGAEIYRADLSRPLDVVREDALFEGGTRTLEPAAEWVFEGEGAATARDGWLVLETGRWTPPSRWQDGAPVWESPSHLVLWLNRMLPDGILVDYEIEVDDPLSGLHLVFFSATNASGGSIFAPGLSRRNAEFDRYTRNPGEMLSYHASLWAAPYGVARRTSNLRKNGPFFLLASGDDRIAGAGRGPHRIRLLKDGTRMAAEVNGIKVLDVAEDEAIYGPSYRGGYLGFRLMGFSKGMRLRGLNIHRLAGAD